MSEGSGGLGCVMLLLALGMIALFLMAGGGGDGK